MAITAKEALSARLVEVMLGAGYKSQRNAKSGVDVGPLAKVAKVTREMARRYTEGTASPDANRLKLIADWLNVRVAWLRDGEGPMRAEGREAHQPAARYEVSDEALELARVWARLSEDARYVIRDVIFMISLAERHFPWLRRGKPSGETYARWEERQLRAFRQLQQRVATVK